MPQYLPRCRLHVRIWCVWQMSNCLGQCQPQHLHTVLRGQVVCSAVGGPSFPAPLHCVQVVCDLGGSASWHHRQGAESRSNVHERPLMSMVLHSGV